MKLCSRCGKEKELSEFVKNKSCLDGHASYCKACRNVGLRNKYATDPEEREARKRSAKNWHDTHKEQHYQRSREWVKANKEKHKENMRKYYKHRRAIDIVFRYSCDIRSEIRKSLKGFKKQSSTVYLGCSVEELIEKLGPRDDSSCHLDHICPLAQAQTKEEVEKLWHYSNLRWLNGKENLAKWAHWTPEGEELCRILLGREWIYD